MQGSSNLVLMLIVSLSGIGAGLRINLEIGHKSEVPHESRPQFHFTPKNNWMNDPNGLVYYDGEYHLFFQHNPYDVEWGHMTWGHAVSKDLVHWEQLENALLPDDHGDIWSGSAVVDRHNSSGLQLDGKDPPLVAFYTNHPVHKWVPHKDLSKYAHDQRLAFSHDKGRTWSKLPKPVIPVFGDERDLEARDPKVEWHEPSQSWIMVLWLHKRKQISTFGLFSSKNLHSWKHIQDIEMDGDYECPDMFELRVAGSQGKDHKYVFLSAGGTYLIGTFDGNRFVPSGPPQNVEYGDGYAAQTYHGLANGRRLQISWLGHPKSKTCQRKQAFQKEVFTGQMSIPMELDLVSLPQGLRLRRLPSKEITALRRATLLKDSVHTMATHESITAKADPGVGLDILLQLQAPSAMDAQLELNLFGEALYLDMKKATSDQEITLGIAMEKTRTESFRALLRTAHGQVLPIQADETGVLTIRAVVDRHSIEIFDASGGASMAICTSRIQPLIRGVRENLVFTASQGQANIKTLEVYELVA